ncbi:hypothetical protein L9W92_15795 [Pelotomaculum terephthalicicum JT]|uniref:hypothetical protein n=1 Tax=Pelotomaculum terephthalicicum TaxID=206393 RepID=UPI001F04E795|nr:hypothetical protein [Pelotomaculum terephthalicicum]MCG9969472.1 hypothetical protein [Pelotomaculum terephthalicicum JT]
MFYPIFKRYWLVIQMVADYCIEQHLATMSARMPPAMLTLLKSFGSRRYSSA